jgi:aromatic amino acid aminotransferase I
MHIGTEPNPQTISPGARLGWFACNSMFAERLLRGTEVQTQHPSGFSQVSTGVGA